MILMTDEIVVTSWRIEFQLENEKKSYLSVDGNSRGVPY